MAKGQAQHSFGLLAEYETPAALYHACEKVRDAGYKVWDAYTPFPVHGLENAMGVGRSFVPWIVLIMGATGASMGFLLQWWTSVLDYPLIISGKPYNSYPAFLPVTFETGIFLGGFGAVLGMMALNKLPQLYHSLFNVPRFSRVTDDRFFIAIESKDPKFDWDETRELLESTGPATIEEVPK